MNLSRKASADSSKSGQTSEPNNPAPEQNNPTPEANNPNPEPTNPTPEPTNPTPEPTNPTEHESPKKEQEGGSSDPPVAANQGVATQKGKEKEQAEGSNARKGKAIIIDNDYGEGVGVLPKAGGSGGRNVLRIGGRRRSGSLTIGRRSGGCSGGGGALTIGRRSSGCGGVGVGGGGGGVLTIGRGGGDGGSGIRKEQKADQSGSVAGNKLDFSSFADSPGLKRRRNNYAGESSAATTRRGPRRQPVARVPHPILMESCPHCHMKFSSMGAMLAHTLLNHPLPFIKKAADERNSPETTETVVADDQQTDPREQLAPALLKAAMQVIADGTLHESTAAAEAEVAMQMVVGPEKEAGESSAAAEVEVPMVQAEAEPSGGGGPANATWYSRAAGFDLNKPPPPEEGEGGSGGF